eukprot:6115724-Prymnesium_polylepis.2
MGTPARRRWKRRPQGRRAVRASSAGTATSRWQRVHPLVPFARGPSSNRVSGGDEAERRPRLRFTHDQVSGPGFDAHAVGSQGDRVAWAANRGSVVEALPAHPLPWVQDAAEPWTKGTPFGSTSPMFPPRSSTFMLRLRRGLWPMADVVARG